MKDISVFRIRLRTGPVQDSVIKQKDVLEYCKNKGIVGLGWEIPHTVQSKKLTIEEAMETRKDCKDYKIFKKNMQIFAKVRKNDIIWARTEDGIYYIGKITDNQYKCWDAWAQNKTEVDKYDIRNVKTCKFYRVGGIEKIPGVIINSFSGPGTTIKRIGKYNDEEFQSKIRILCKMIFNKVCENSSENYAITNEDDLDFWKIISDQDMEEIIALYLQFEENYKIYINTKRRDTPKYEFIMVNPNGQKAAVQVKSGNNVTLRVEDYKDDKDYEKIFLFSINEDKKEYEKSNQKVVIIKKEDIEKFLIQKNDILPDSIRDIMILCGWIKK